VYYLSLQLKAKVDQGGSLQIKRCSVGARVGLMAMALCLPGLFPNAISMAQTPAKKSATKAPHSTDKTDPKSEQPKFKAIWEPVNVKEDLELMSVHFATADEGWVGGGRSSMQGGVILHTKDGGDHWEVQLGDPQSSDRAYGNLRFAGPKIGFAVQSTGVGDHQLLRTTDGQSWAPSGTVGQHRNDYRFISADVGFYTHGADLQRTQNAGRKWERVYQCRVKAEMNGLTRDVNCEFEQLYFVDANVGYATSHGIGSGAGFVMAKTEDGGATWTPWVILPGEDGKEGALHFFDANTGVMRTINGKVFRTADGGKTWTGVPGHIDGKPDIEFADAEVGWMMRYNTMTYTTNGGKSWVSRNIGFPAGVNAFSLVQRDRGYAAGSHGMVYRYRIVPIDYTSKGMLAAPAMPAR
jgi:photosystem II stability/assembly factor-like uncharacterized protein